LSSSSSAWSLSWASWVSQIVLGSVDCDIGYS
jgi:hypothetical protein